MIEFPALAKSSADAYPLSEMLADVRQGIWTELGASRVTIQTARLVRAATCSATPGCVRFTWNS